MSATDSQILDARRLIPGLTAVGLYAAYVWRSVRLRKVENILWACHLGCLLVGIGWLAGWPLANVVGLLWLLPGILFWALYLAGGGAFTWISLFIHVGGTLLGIGGVSALGFPTGVWWKAGLAYIALMLVSRRFSRTSENVNFSIQVWQGSEKRFPSYKRYVAGLVVGAFALFYLIEQVLLLFFSATN